MNSSIFITLLSLAIVGALAYFAAVGFRGSGKNEELPANLTKYKSDDELETKHLDKSLSCLLYTSPSPRDVEESRMPSSA